MVRVAAGSLALPGLGQAGLALRVQEGGDGGPVQGTGLACGGQGPVGMAADLGRRGQDVPAAEPEVQVAAGQVAAVLGGAGEVGVQAAAGGSHVGCGAVEQPGLLELAEGGVAAACVAVLVDVQDVGAGGAGGDGQVPAGMAAVPGGDLVEVGGGVAVAVGGGGDLLAGLAGEDGPAAGGVGQGPAQGGIGHGVFQEGAGMGAWPQPVVSVLSWAARAGRMRAWYSAWAETRPGVRSGCKYSTDHRLGRMSRPYRHRSWASQQGARAAARCP